MQSNTFSFQQQTDNTIILLFKKLNYLLPCIFLLACSGCGIYSFTGASIDPNVKTYTVHPFANQAQIVVASLANSMTEALRFKFITSTNLKQVESDGDLEFQAVIMSYQVLPVAPQANEIAAVNRLTITVSVEYFNHQDEKQSWTSSFSRYADYDSNKDLAIVQDDLIKDINEQLVDDIFNKAVVNW
ncbi:MAG: LptE family protein [Chitinophagaceae bacterium]|nr:LptE family protein [Chitinophagaceae bacterium]